MFYDLLGQLVREDNAADNRTYVWEYDGNGNILNKKEYAFTTESTLGTVLNTVSYGYNDSNWKDLLTSYNGVTISSDLSGNPLNWRNASSMTWSGRKLTGLTLTDNAAVSYTYNAGGIRTSKAVGTRHTEYLLDGTKVLKQITTDISNTTREQILFYYDVNEELVGFSYLGHDYWYGKDINGVIRYIYNESGEICAEYTYDAWGRVISAANLNGGAVANVNPFRYKSYYYDNETGFYYLISRYYDPTVARFISADSIDFLGASGSVLSYNLFAYCENEPVLNCDPSGKILLSTCVLIGIGIGALLGAGYGAVSSYRRTGEVSWKATVKWAFVGGAIGAAVGYIFGVAIGAAGAGGSVGFSSQASRLAKQAGKLTYSSTIKKHFATRAYYGSTQILQQIIRAANPIKDASLKYGLKWLVPGSIAGSKVGTTIYGMWELVIDASKNQIVHWLFKPYK